MGTALPILNKPPLLLSVIKTLEGGAVVYWQLVFGNCTAPPAIFPATCAVKGMRGHSCRYDAWSEHNEVYGLIYM